MKTTFSRTFSTTAIILLLALLLVGTSFQALVKDYLTDSTVTELQQHSTTIADLAAAYYAEGSLMTRDFLVNLDVASQVSGSDVVICNALRQVVLCSDTLTGCNHQGLRVDGEYMRKVVENGGDVDVNDFRYDGPRPISREAAIVMMADTVEAAARSMPNPDSGKLNQLIRNLVRQKTDDGQLDKCQLTFADIEKICMSFYTVLSGVFHERIEYPSIEIPRSRARILPESKPAESQKEEKPAEDKQPEEKDASNTENTQNTEEK